MPSILGPRHRPATDQPDSRDGVVRGPKRPSRDAGGAVAGEAGAAVHAGGFDAFGQGQVRQDGGEPPRQANPGQPAQALLTRPAPAAGAPLLERQAQPIPAA
jgi:hypothetical protein